MLSKTNSLNIPINFPVKRNVYKFLLTHFGESYHVSFSDWLGIVVFNILKKQGALHEKDNRYCPSSEYPLTYQVIFSEEYYFKFFSLETPNKNSVLQFNALVSSIMNFTFINNVEVSLEPRAKNKKEAIERFINSNNLTEEDISFDALKKAHYRFRKSGKPILLSSF